MLVRRTRIVAFLIFGLAGGADAGQEGRDMRLEDMGFVMRPADTAARIERLRLLPPRTFVARSKEGGTGLVTHMSVFLDPIMVVVDN